MSKAKKVNPIFAKRLRDLRESKGLKRPQVLDLITKKTGVTICPNSLRNYEVGNTNIKEDISKMLAATFDCDPRYFTDEDFKYPTRNDEIADVMRKSGEENYYMTLAIVSLLKLNGYDVEINNFANAEYLDEALKKMKRHIVVSKDGKELFALSFQEAHKLENNLDKSFNVLLSYYLNDEV